MRSSNKLACSSDSGVFQRILAYGSGAGSEDDMG